jgi:E3 ubiquitin-protein ligase MARCH6
MEGGEDVVADEKNAGEPGGLKSDAQGHEGTFGGSNEDGDYCRICRGEATDELPLFYPCKCSGSIKFVHQDCLMEWLSHSQKKHCELCKTPFRFTKLYDHRMPQTLPLPLFIRQICLHAVRNTLRWIRYLLVGLVWLGWLPWSIRQVWRGLFWLADGSWGDMMKLDGNQSSPLQDLRNSTGNTDVTAVLGINATNELARALPQMVAPISGFLGYTSSDFLLIKIVRFLYPNLFNWSAGLIQTGSSNATAFFRVSDREPSFLSDVQYLRTLTSYPTINHSIIDVFEGQLICLLIVTAFILIFLIREWVINQQPVVPLPADNQVDEARPGVEDGALRGHVRRRRRRAADEGREQRVRRIAMPRARRRFAPLDPETELGNVETPETPGNGRTDDVEGSGMTSASSGFRVENQPIENQEGSSKIGRPAMRARNSHEDVASIRRTIEEGIPSRSSPEWPGLETFKELWNRADHDPAMVLGIIREENREGELGWIVAQMERLQRHPQPWLEIPASVIAEGTQKSDYAHADDIIYEIGPFTPPPDLPLRLPSPGNGLPRLEGEESMPPRRRIERNLSESWNMLDSAETPAEPLSNLTTAPHFPDADAGSPTGSLPGLPPTSLSGFPVASITAEPSNENAEELDEAPNIAVVLGNPGTIPQEGRNLDHLLPTIDALADWLWQTDQNPPQPDERFDQVNAHLVEDADHDAPFIPIPLVEIGSDIEDEVEEEQNAEVVAAAAAAGIDLNNAEAVEDAEDLDGILELIGMQGPLTGMVQNVIFSEFLISLTLAMSVWLPYIWGKIVLLLLANPFGVFVKAPLYLLSLVANTSVDVSLFVSGICVYVLKFGLDFLIYLVSLVHPVSRSWINTSAMGKMSLSLASGSGSRLERAIFQTFGGLRPDLPTFSVLSHQALHVFQRQLVAEVQTLGQFLVYVFYGAPLRLNECIRGGVGVNKFTIYDTLQFIMTSYRQTVSDLGRLYQGLYNFRSLKLGIEGPLDTGSLDYSLARWSTKDRVIAILIGYTFFAFAGYLYIKISRLVLGLKPGDKVEGIVADSLKQAGGVMKVILIISIEMIVFPLYCGFLLDVALMPLFEGVGFHSRLAFVMKAPITAVFVHWFVGTCYMFHFALFVAMCRKIMRRGVLYFIRDPDDPTFHPVRDVLERPIAIQLSKIAFSGLVYGGLVILCLGGIVWMVSRLEGIFPIHWTSNEPILEFPIDFLFYSFLIPILIRSVEPSKKLNAMYEWWFRKCARWLRLSNFLFNEQHEDEQGQHVRGSWSAIFQRKQVVDKAANGEDRQLETSFIRDGTFVRAPGSDSVRIPKGGRVFLEVDDGNNGSDGQNDGQNDEGELPHGNRNDSFVKVYIPPMFRARIAAFVGLVWVFAAVSGIAFTIAPLSLGRKCILLITQGNRPPNDLYAFSVGLYLCGSGAYAFTYYEICREWALKKIDHYFNDTKHALPRLWSSFVYFGGLAYMGITFGFILPFLFSTLVELYFVAPLHTYLTSTYTPRAPAYNYSALPPTIHVIQTWTLGLVYLRVVVRLVTNQPDPQTRAATAIQSILRQGFWRPDIRLATRAFVLPSLVVTSMLLVAPLGLGWTINVMLGQSELQAKVYRYAYPGILGVALALYCALLLKRQVGVWRTRIRDEVYLIGERLHNFGEAQRRQSKEKGKARMGDRPVSERLQIR